jgi:hypothetical protein
MRKRLQYEEMDQNFSDLPLPDEDVAWQKMNEMLDKDDDDPPFVPVLFRSCFGWGIALMLGVAVVWLSIRPEKSERNVTSRNEASAGNKTLQTKNDKRNAGNAPNVSSITLTNDSVTKTVTMSKHNNVDVTIKSPASKIQKKMSGESLRKTNQLDQPQAQAAGRGIEYVGIDGKAKVNNLMTSPKSMADNFARPITARPNQSLKSTPMVNTSNYLADRKKINKKQGKLFVNAGIGIQQQIPIVGQAVAPYNYNGTKGSLPDYLPHIYAQMQKENKWFVEGDFKFGMAQAVDEFSYSQKTTYDSATMNLTVTTMNLMETYYHDLSLSFNYFLLRNLSFGVGGIYSRFHGAISEQEISTSNIPTQTNSSVKQIIPMKHFTDSFLYRNQLRVLMQASYEWKRLSFSLRYAKDIQPYIKYTRPDGTVNEKKNQSLQFLLRYRLWQTRRF